MFNVKEHIIAIVAVFLALGIGILVGISLGGNFLVASQKEVIEQLESELIFQKEFALTTKEENVKLNKQISYWKQLETYITPSFLKEALKGKRILVFHNNDEHINEIKDFLREVGADVGSVSLSYLPKTDWERVNEKHSFSAASFIEFLRKEPGRIVDFSKNAEAEDEGDSLLLPEAVLIGDGGDGCPIVSEIGRLFVKDGTPVITVLLSGNILSHHISLRQDGLTLIDNIDSFLGKLSLVFLLRDYRSGHYGFHPSADSLFP